MSEEFVDSQTKAVQEQDEQCHPCNEPEPVKGCDDGENAYDTDGQHAQAQVYCCDVRIDRAAVQVLEDDVFIAGNRQLERTEAVRVESRFQDLLFLEFFPVKDSIDTAEVGERIKGNGQGER